jgi:AbrB family transcriptional regulator (stage V sporulation protein T)
MQDTGIVRRIDELGRVVIPKELRKTLRIREGDPLEIHTNKDELVLKKYSPINALKADLTAVGGGIKELMEKPCVITDSDKVLFVTDGKYKEAVGKSITEDIEKILKERKCVTLSKSDDGKVIPIIKGDDLGAENQIILPIISGGDCFGSIIVFDTDKTYRFNNADQRLVTLAATLLGKQFES